MVCSEAWHPDPSFATVALALYPASDGAKMCMKLKGTGIRWP